MPARAVAPALSPRSVRGNRTGFRLGLLHLFCLLVIMLTGVEARGQSYTVVSIVPENGGSIGSAISAVSGNTEYSISAATGAVSRIAGTGLPVTAQNTRALVTIRCTVTSGNGCGTNANNAPSANITLTAGSFTGRTAALKNFRAAAGTGTPSATQGTGSTFSFTVKSVPGNNSTTTFYVGADFTVTTSGNSGTATANYTLTASGAANPSGSSSSSAFSATVTRPISLVESSALSFGNVYRPTTDTGTVVTISESNGALSFSGGNGGSAGGTTSRAQYTVSGENGQTFSVTLGSSTMTMNGSAGGSITVNLVRSATSGTLTGGSASAAGTATVGVGGNFNITKTTPPGAYTGTFTVTVDYN